MTKIGLGTQASDFIAIDQDGNKVKLSDFRGKAVALYFYPKDDTPGCTAEACSFRDDMVDVQASGIKVLGVSSDSAESHKRFERKHKLNFTLVADPDREIIKAYGVKGPFGVARRVTFLIDKDGVIRHVWPKVSPKDHSKEVIAKVKELGL